MESQAKIELFLAEFSAFETHSVGLALRSLSNDASLVADAERLLNLEARLKLLKRMAFVRNLDPSSCAQIDRINVRATRLSEKRDELTVKSRLVKELRGKISDTPRGGDAPPTGRERSKMAWVPTVAEIDECREEATYLKSTLRQLAEGIDGKDAPAGAL